MSSPLAYVAREDVGLGGNDRKLATWICLYDTLATLTVSTYVRWGTGEGGGAGSHQLGRGRAFRRGGGFCTPVGMTGGKKGDQRNKGGELQPRRVSEKKEG